MKNKLLALTTSLVVAISLLVAIPVVSISEVSDSHKSVAFKTTTNNNSGKKNTNTSAKNNNSSKKNTSQNNSSAKKYSYGELGNIDAMFLSYSDAKKWAQAKGFTYYESKENGYYTLTIAEEDELNKGLSNRARKGMQSAADAYLGEMAESLIGSLDEWLSGGDVTFEGALDKADRSATDKATRAGVGSAIDNNSYYVYCWADAASTPDYAVLLFLKQNRDNFMENAKKTYPAVKGYNNLFNFENQFGKDYRGNGNIYMKSMIWDDTYYAYVISQNGKMLVNM